jgi:aspartyl-tRNA(Asn)/glutamyl-tRNA(Gln) amidotransferase subunit A
VTGLRELSARELLAAFRARQASPVEALDAVAEQIARVDGALGAFNTLCLERARVEALAAEDEFRRGSAAGLLAGLPFAVKDLFDSEGVRTTYGSPMFAKHVPGADAEAVRRARAAGAVLVGKTQTHEFAWGITSVNTLLGTSRNPWATDRISGGSSGGSAVALASHQVPLALGSDTGGSIRVPSAFCGTVGFKPTYGRISLAGAWPLARTLDHPGPMARTPADAALLFEAIAGYDPNDPATEDIPLAGLGDALARGLEGAIVGHCPDLHGVPLTPDIREVFDQALATVRNLGARVEVVALPEASVAYETFSATQRAEALFTHVEAGLYPDRAEEYGADVRGRLEAAARESTHDYLRAAAARQRLRSGFARVFRDVDVLLTPASAGSPAPLGTESVLHLGETIDFRELVMTYTVPQDLAGLPACVVRAGFDRLGIPVGVQFTGAAWADAGVLGAADAFWGATPLVQDRWPEAPAAAATGSHAERVENLL